MDGKIPFRSRDPGGLALALHAPPEGRQRRLRGGIPRVGAGARQAGADGREIHPAVGRNLDVHHMAGVRRPAAGDPPQDLRPAHHAALVQRQQHERALAGRPAGIDGPAINPKVGPAAVGFRFGRPGHGGIRRIDQGRRDGIVFKCFALRIIMPALALRMDIPPHQVHEQRIAGQRIAVGLAPGAPRRQIAEAGFIHAVGHAGIADPGKQRIRVGPVIGIVVAEEVRGADRMDDMFRAIGHEHAVADIDASRLDTDQGPGGQRGPVGGGRQAGDHAAVPVIRGRRNQGAQRLGHIEAGLEEIQRGALDEPVLVGQFAQVEGVAPGPFGTHADEPVRTGLRKRQALLATQQAHIPHFQVPHALQVNHGTGAVGEDGAAGGFVGAALDDQVVRGRARRDIDFQRCAAGIDARVHIDGVAMFHLDAPQQRLQGIQRRIRAEAGVGGTARRRAIHVAIGAGVVQVIGQRIVLDGKQRLGLAADRAVGGAHPPNSLRRAGEVGSRPRQPGAARVGIDVQGNVGPVGTGIAGKFDVDPFIRRQAVPGPIQLNRAPDGTAVRNGDGHERAGTGALAGFRRVAVQAHIDPSPVVGRFVCIGRSRIPQVDQPRGHVVIGPSGRGEHITSIRAL